MLLLRAVPSSSWQIIAGNAFYMVQLYLTSHDLHQVREPAKHLQEEPAGSAAYDLLRAHLRQHSHTLAVPLADEAGKLTHKSRPSIVLRKYDYTSIRTSACQQVLRADFDRRSEFMMSRAGGKVMRKCRGLISDHSVMYERR